MPTMATAKLLISLVLLVSGQFGYGYKTDSSNSSAEDTAENVARKWKQFNEDGRNTIESLIRRALPYVMQMNSDVPMSPECLGALLKILFGIREMQTWAFQFLDSWGRPHSGILRGSITDLGDYDECVSTRLMHEDQIQERFRGQYCTIISSLKLPPKPDKLTLATKLESLQNISKPGTVIQDMLADANFMYRSKSRLGICVPSVCSVQDVEGVARGLLGNAVTEVSVPHCEVEPESTIPQEQVITLCLILTFLTFILVATAADILRQNYKIESIRFDNFAHTVRHFSLYTNTICLFRTEGTRMQCVDGARFLSMAWLLLAHTYGLMNAFALANQKRILTMVKELPFQVITNPTLSVDTFFVIGGLVIAYSTLKSLDKSKGSLNVVRFIIRRIWRLLPPMVMTLGILYLLPMFGSGPLWHEVVESEVEKCRKGWWVALLFLTSWVPWKDMCLSHFWYLSVDFQLFLLTPVVLVLLHRRPAWGLFIVGLYFLAGVVVMATLTVMFDLYPYYIFVTPDKEFSEMVGDLTYYKPYAHVGPYFIGVVIGYIIYKYPNLLIRKWIRVCLWSASMVLMFLTLFGTYEWNNGHLPNMATSVLSQSFIRTAWGLGVAWMLYTCILQCGGPIGVILSWKVMVPLGKLSYTMYLYQFLILWYRNGVKRHQVYLSHFEIVYEFFGSFLATLVLSFFGYLVAEAPFVSLDSVIFPRTPSVASVVSESEENLKKEETKSITHL